MRHFTVFQLYGFSSICFPFLLQYIQYIQYMYTMQQNNITYMKRCEGRLTAGAKFSERFVHSFYTIMGD